MFYDMFICLNKVAKNNNFEKRTGIWTCGASGTPSWWANLTESSCVLRNFHFFEKSCKTCQFQNCYCNLDFGRLPGRALAGQINCAVLCVFEICISLKQVATYETFKIATVILTLGASQAAPWRAKLTALSSVF